MVADPFLATSPSLHPLKKPKKLRIIKQEHWLEIGYCTASKINLTGERYSTGIGLTKPWMVWQKLKKSKNLQ